MAFLLSLDLKAQPKGRAFFCATRFGLIFLRILPKLRGIHALHCVFSAKAQKSLFIFLQGGFYRFEQHKTKKAL